MIERERAEFGCFSTQISREWHMGHAAKASVGLSSDPRSSSAPRRFQRFMIRGPFSTVLAPFARWGARRRAAGSLARFSKRLQYYFDHLRHRGRLPLKRRAVRGLSPRGLSMQSACRRAGLKPRFEQVTRETRDNLSKEHKAGLARGVALVPQGRNSEPAETR